MQNSMEKTPFFWFRREIPFMGKHDPKFKIGKLHWNFVPGLIQIYKTRWWCSFCLFWTGNTLFGGKFGTHTNSNMQNSMVVFTFLFRQEMSFLSRFRPKNEKCQFKLKFCAQANSNIQNSTVVFTFSILERKYLFWTRNNTLLG